jgi:nucleotide-binding universal stress UspA family protein
LCPVDYSEGSRQAMHAAAELARNSQAALVLVHVGETPPWVTGKEKQIPSDVLRELMDAEETMLARWQAEARELGVSEVAIAFREGTAWDQIVSAAREDPAIDLIVMGTHGRTGIKRALIGSVAERVVRHAPCAVMVVRSRDDKPKEAA